MRVFSMVIIKLCVSCKIFRLHSFKSVWLNYFISFLLGYGGKSGVYHMTLTSDACIHASTSALLLKLYMSVQCWLEGSLSSSRINAFRLQMKRLFLNSQFSWGVSPKAIFSPCRSEPLGMTGQICTPSVYLMKSTQALLIFDNHLKFRCIHKKC